MSSLIILGNTNRFTFANSIIAANSISLEKFEKPFTHIFVIHSIDSQKMLSQQIDWMDHLEKNNISRELLTQRIIEIDFTAQSIERFVEFIEFIVNGVLISDPNLIVDLTNGTTVHKNLLSTAAYILELGHQYIIDIVKLGDLTKERGYLPLDILKASYVAVPEATQLDNIAYLNLTEILRYKRIIKKHTNKYEQIDRIAADRNFFEGNLSHSIRLKLLGDKKEDNAVYRIAASSVSASVEDLISILIDKFIPQQTGDKDTRRTLGRKFTLIESEIKKISPPNFDFEFLRQFNQFVVYLRNSSTHKNSALLKIEEFKADLSTKITFPFIDYYCDIIFPILATGKTIDHQKSFKIISPSEINPQDIFYFGLDGDNTGLVLQDLFLFTKDEMLFQKMSQSVEQAISNSVQFIKDTFLNGDVIFAAGDDILFKGHFNETGLQELQQIYHTSTSGMSCSIGFGRSLQEVYLALKIAKAEPGKNHIIGIQII